MLESRGLLVAAIRPPSVPEGGARLRIALNVAHENADVDALLDALEPLAAEFRERERIRRMLAADDPLAEPVAG
jgi:8-amino-7-oxononanoate synthase